MTDMSSEVFSEVLKPVVDMVVFTLALAKLQGKFGPIGMCLSAT